MAKIHAETSCFRHTADRPAALDETGLLDLPQAAPFTIEQALNDPLIEA